MNQTDRRTDYLAPSRRRPLALDVAFATLALVDALLVARRVYRRYRRDRDRTVTAR